ncbi:hypothetical protein Cgig2_016690 [Carnegiea gigantea]|uniref:Zinc knuckle CX2CX4HX4C domain-containing protein n=1 Tax=Carnegiea gigantea TaxID=171969 RepID=A0A9Q1L070_9CARY|nr:hypothetical protein Cgig2_016690 [Carnegiea gigantea]
MADKLEEEWSRLSLTQEEAKIVEFEEETPAEKVEQIALSLLGKLMMEGSFNARVMKNVLKNIWKPSKGLVRRDLYDNFFMFQFSSATDKRFEWTRLEHSSKIVFTMARFWVKAYDVPGVRQTKNFAEFLGSHIGTFVDCEDSNMFGADRSLCFRVDVDIKNPLRQGVSVKIDGKSIWIRPKYVKLPDFCYGCGKLGYVFKACNLVDGDMNDADLQYGSWLRASPLKFRRRSAEGKGGRATKLRLVFDETHSLSKGNGPHIGKERAQQIDDNVIVTPSSEVFKRKLEERKSTKEVEKDQVMESDSSAQRKSRRIRLLWDKMVDLTLLSYLLYHMDVRIKLEGEDIEWRFTGIYGWA